MPPTTRQKELGRGERVIPGLWRLRLPLPWPGVPHCNAWAIASGPGVVLVDTGHAGMWMSQYFDLTQPEQDYLRSCGHLGWAFSAGIGAKCAVPDRPVIVFTGDAGFYYHLAEIETAVRYNINTVTIVNDNSGGNQSKRGFDRAYHGEPTEASRRMWTYNDVDLAKVRRAIDETTAYLRSELGEQAWAEGMNPEIPEHEQLANPYTYTGATAWKEDQD